MKKSLELILVTFIVIIIFKISLIQAETWDWKTSSNWAYKMYGNYMIRNNIWGATVWPNGVGSQTIYANSERQWMISATHTNGTGSAAGQVKAYPHVVRGWVLGGIGNKYADGTSSPFVNHDDTRINIKINDLTKLNLHHDLQLPKSGRYMLLWDTYYYITDKPALPYDKNRPDYAVMIFTNMHDDTGWLYTDAEKYPIVTIGDRQWRLRVSYNESNPNRIVRIGGTVFILYPYPSFTNEHLTINLKEILHYLRDNHGMDGNARVSSLQMGVEIIDGGEYKINEFWTAINDEPDGTVRDITPTTRPIQVPDTDSSDNPATGDLRFVLYSLIGITGFSAVLLVKKKKK